MTISTTTSSVTYQGNGATTVFTFPFVADSSSDVDVYYTDSSGSINLLSPSVYTLTINAVPVGGLWGIGGSATYPIIGAPILAGTSLSIVRSVPYTQDVSISNQGAFYPQVVEQGLDVLELQIQQIVNEKDLAIRVPVTDPTAQTILPAAAGRVSQLIGFDGTGENVQMYPTSAVPGPIAFLSQAVTHAMSPYTVTTANLLFVNASAGDVTIILPTAVTVKQIFISRTDATYGNAITIQAAAAQTIIGSSTFTNLKWQYQSNVFVSDNVSNWDITSQFRKITPTGITNAFVSFLNFFDVVNDPNTIAGIQNGTGPGVGGYLDSFMSAAIALGGEIYFPKGDYHFQNTVTMAPGVIFTGAGQGNTQFFTGGTTWGFELLNPNGTQHIEAPKFKNMTIQVATTAGNGIRWNSITGGFTDDGSSQQYMFRPRLEGVSFNLDTATPGIAVQMNKCFDYWIQGCGFTGFNYPIDFEGSDIGTFINNRTDGTKIYEVLANSHGTFGSDLFIRENDFNDPGANNAAGGFVNSTYRSLGIYDNHMETDTATVRTNLISISGGESFMTKIKGNRIDNVLAPTNWLNVAGSTNNYLVSVHDNVTAGAPATMGSVSFSGQNYFNNSGGRCLVTHSGNGNGETNFPMDSSVSYYTFNPVYIALVTASSAGVSFANSTINPPCQNGFFALAPDANAGHFMEISDWTGLPNNNLIGTVTITCQTAGAVNGVIGSWEVYDGASSVASGTLTHTTANQLYYTQLVVAHAFTTKAKVIFWNADTTRNERFYIASVGFSL